MSSLYSDNYAHRTAIQRLEGIRQSAVAAAGFDQCLIKAAEIAFYQAVQASAQSNKVNSDQFAEALVELGKATCFTAPAEPGAGGAQSEPFPIIL